jgi:catechol 2,3-dioxygenase-like lactoylglutathione lyase family enzyme
LRKGDVQHIALVSLVVRDYDEAIDFYTKVVGFDLVEDTPQPGKRWVVVRPHGGDTGLLLARAANDVEASRIGNQTGGRVFLFLKTRDFHGDHQRMLSAGVHFLESPRDEPYGWVAVWEDPWGNRWDLLEDRDGEAARI